MRAETESPLDFINESGRELTRLTTSGFLHSFSDFLTVPDISLTRRKSK